MDPQEDKNRKRIHWFAQRVTLGTTSMFPGIDYRDIEPAVKTLEDQEFLPLAPKGLVEEAIELCPHIFFSLPAMGLKVSQMIFSPEVDDNEAISVGGFYSKRQSSNKGTKLLELLHRVVKDPDSEEMNFETTYGKLNNLVKTASFDDKNLMRSACSLYVPFVIDGNVFMGEDAVKDAFKTVLDPICKLFSGLWKSTVQLGSMPLKYSNQLDESDKKIYSATPDIVVAEDGRPLVCIEVKRHFINFTEDNAFSDSLTQTVSQCVASGTPYGAFTDYLNTICFRILLGGEDIQSTKNNTYDKEVTADMTMYKRVKVMYYTVNHRDSVNTLGCVLAAHIFDAREDMLKNKDNNKQLLYKLGGALQLTPEEIDIRDRQSYEKFLVSIDSQNTRHAGKICFKLEEGKTTSLSMYEIPFTEDSSITIVHEGPQYNAQVIMISGDVFREITGVSPKDDHYILKIFDPVKGRYRGEETRETFVREYKAYDELKSLWGQCIPRFYHAGYCSFHEGERIRFGGLFMIFQLIEGLEPDLTDYEVVQSAQDGLDMIHALGVIHGDVVLRNMIQTADKKVFLVDFGLAGDYETGNKMIDIIELQRAIDEAFANLENLSE